MSGIDQAMNRVATDRTFRAQLLEDTNAALAEYQLSTADRERLLQHAETIEAEIMDYPLEATEADHGQADAGGSKA